VRNHSLMLFVWYRIILGTLILLVMATGLR
jgi:undecaprenyl pyrophosphate phosphatase UppP